MAKSSKTHQTAQDSNLYTELKDRVLYFDGDTVIPASDIQDYISEGASTHNLRVEEMTNEIEVFNSFVDAANKITVKDSVRDLDFNWNIPDEYLKLDVEQFLYDRFDKEIASMPYSDSCDRAIRLKREIAAYWELNFEPILRTVIYIINTLRSYNIVWGIGRGSSVSSYVLYLIGVHDVDSVTYDLDYTDFLR